MAHHDALYLLFSHDFGNGPLFKNQIEIVTDLIETSGSAYNTDKKNIEEYQKAVNRLKAYISQLLSEYASRKVSKEFISSLKILVAKKLQNTSLDAEEISDSIIKDLQKKNQRIAFSQPSSSLSSRSSGVIGDFIQEVLEAEYISVFTSREIKFEYELQNKTISFIDLLLNNLLTSFRDRLPLKYYRFNFPLEQTSQLFWRGLRKELTNYLITEKKSLGSIIASLKIYNNSEFTLNKTNELKLATIEEDLASQILIYLSNKEIINVFHLKAPAYLVPSVAINPNKNGKASTYIFLQSENDSEYIHKLSNEELIFWRFFVWDNLKKNKSGNLIKYSPIF